MGAWPTACRIVESVSAALVRAWAQEFDPVAAERCLWSVRLGLGALERALGAGQPAAMVATSSATPS